jgi:hypothetical protein
MTETSASIRFDGTGAAQVRTYVRLTASTRIHCCTYTDAAPILTIQDGAADITITNPGHGEVTEQDVTFGRELAEAVATLTTQGRAVGYCVVAALQDPRKDVLAIRNLFPDRIAMRLDEPEQVDMVLGDGARDRGAACELISTDPATGPGWRSSGWKPTRIRCGSAPGG